jgi:hypothetical protein
VKDILVDCFALWMSPRILRQALKLTRSKPKETNANHCKWEVILGTTRDSKGIERTIKLRIHYSREGDTLRVSKDYGYGAVIEHSWDHRCWVNLGHQGTVRRLRGLHFASLMHVRAKELLEDLRLLPGPYPSGLEKPKDPTNHLRFVNGWKK